MKQLKDLYQDILESGSFRTTRTGDTLSVWKRSLDFDLSGGDVPAVTSKRLAFNVCVGELLWFLSGSTSIRDLKAYTFNDPDADRWTIWTDDTKRWHQYLFDSGLPSDYDQDQDAQPDYVGDLYGVQWRNFNRSGVDQIASLINGLINAPFERDHIVMAWNPEGIANRKMALKPCHIGFQCYVDNDYKLHLNWSQRSVDSFLGLPVNIFSYSVLLKLLAHWTGLEPGSVSCDLGDVHIYQNHIDAVVTYLDNKEYQSPELFIPERARESLDGALTCTAKDFALIGYENEGVIKAPLSVG